MADRDNTLFRWATRWDREAVRTLMATLAAEHDFVTDPEALDTAFEHALRNPDRIRFCVAERNRVIVGMASLHDFYSTWRGKSYGTIEDVHVSEDARRSGVCTGMLDFLKGEALRRGYCRLTLLVVEGNAPARAAYEQWGMEWDGSVHYVVGLEE
jgi:RimJ/RimL family protein N-acetyltransferase